MSILGTNMLAPCPRKVLIFGRKVLRKLGPAICIPDRSIDAKFGGDVWLGVQRVFFTKFFGFFGSVLSVGGRGILLCRGDWAGFKGDQTSWDMGHGWQRIVVFERVFL